MSDDRVRNDDLGDLPALRDVGALAPEWLDEHHRIHLIGVGGAGMSAIATVLVAMGHEVSGSDIKDSVTLARLGALGVHCKVGHEAANVGSVDAVIFSSAVRDSNPELKEARGRGLTCWRRSQVLAAITRLRPSLVVVGTHGKTSTTSLLAVALRAAGMDPSFLIGGDLNEAGTNAHWGEGKYVVAEGDESDGTFLLLESEGAIVTGVEADHLENWGGSLAAIHQGFAQFMADVRGPLVVCSDDSGAMSALAKSGAEAITYGTAPTAQFVAEVSSVRREGTRLRVLHGGSMLIEALLPQPGRHFALNATGAAALAHSVGADDESIARAISRFGGVDRRFQFKGEGDGVLVYDDYAHLPTEIAVTVESAAAIATGRVIAVFQPHLYSRTKTFRHDFAKALAGADVVAVTGVFGAREDPVPGVTGRMILDEVARLDPSVLILDVPRRVDLTTRLVPLLRSGDVVVTMGAGDITATAPEIVIELRRRES